MIPAFITVTVLMLWAAGSQAVLITQWPHYIVTAPSVLAEMHCYQNDTDYQYMYWYRQRGKSLQLIVTIVGATSSFEEGFKSGFQAVTSKEKQWSLTVPSVQSEHEAVYLCAASLGQTFNDPAYFGQGTKLTVLERDPNPPQVKVLRPSQKECRNKKKTLVCVASKFYPDHVSVYWKINGDNHTDGVVTDNNALKKDDGYTITSRLRIAAEDWYSPDKEFMCIVSFYDGKETKDYPKVINGVEAPAAGRDITRERYLRLTNAAKLSYGVFIAKSCIYGAFVAFLVWKLQGSTGKQSN